MRGALLVYIIFLSIVTAILTSASSEKGATAFGTFSIGIILGIPIMKGAAEGAPKTEG